MSGKPRTETALGTNVLCVDLDGTLIHSDLLWESFLSAVRNSPSVLFHIPLWIAGGRARLKRGLAARADIDYAGLPWNTEVRDWVRDQQSAGRRVILATAADSELAKHFALEAGLFEEVFATGEGHNLKGSNKAQLLQKRYGEAFDYVGDSGSDWAVWSVCDGIIAVGTPSALTEKLKATGRLVRHFRARRTTSRDWIRQIRVIQWAKNVLVFAPLLAAHQVLDPARVFSSLLAFLCLSFVASGTYIINDLLDVTVDRRHPVKRNRPIAAGRIFIPVGIAASFLLLFVGIGSAALVLPRIVPLLLLYSAASLAYSLYLKRLALIDVFFLSGLYAMRFFIGGVAAGVSLSGWFLSFTIFLFLSLGFAKRAAELRRISDTAITIAAGRGYHREDFHSVAMFGIASAFVSALLLTLYLQSTEAVKHYANPNLLWAVFPLPLYWLTRVWLKAFRGTLQEDPVSFALHDRVSWILALVAFALLWVAAMDPFQWASNFIF